MEILHKLEMDLENKGPTPWLELPQGDVSTRKIRFLLTANRLPWVVPEDAVVLICYRKPDGTEGEYDTLPDGTPAWVAENDTLTVALAPQVLTCVGTVMLYASIRQGEKVLNTFGIEIRVRMTDEDGKENRIDRSEDYFYMTRVMPGPATGEVGQYLRIEAVDAQGRVTRVQAVDITDHTQSIHEVTEQLGKLHASAVTSTPKEFDETEKAQARQNIGALSQDAEQRITDLEKEQQKCVKNTDYADDGHSGVVKMKLKFGTQTNGNGELYLVHAQKNEIDERQNAYKPIVPYTLEYAVKSVGDGYYAKEADVQSAFEDLADINRHAKYFSITEDGVLSLKPEFRGDPTKNTYPDAISDQGLGIAGSQNAELPEHLVIPEIVGEIAVDSLVTGAFYTNKVIKTVTFPKTVKAIPKNCFCNCYALEQVYNVQDVTSIDANAFQNTNLKSIYLPNLKTMGKQAFCQCSGLTHVHIGKVTEILNDTFYKCRSLSRVESDNLITSVGTTALMNTNRLVNAEFVKNLKNIGISAFVGSNLDYDWSSLQNCTFGTSATWLQINPTDFWSNCQVTECENPLPTLLCQSDPRWNDRAIGSTGLKYGANGCQWFATLHIYCGLHGLQISTAEEFEEVIESVNPGHLHTFRNNDSNIKPFAEGLGLSVMQYSSFNQANLQALYDALAAGKYAIIKASSGSTTGAMTGHVVVAYGLTASGKIKFADCDYRYFTDKTKGGCIYSLPYKCVSAPTSAFWVFDKV